MNAFLLISGLVVLTLAIVAASTLHEKKKNRMREDNLQAVAEEMGLKFVSRADEEFQHRVSDFKLFNKGHRRKILNIVVGETDDFDLTIFDYHYTTGGGQHQQRHKRCVALMESPTLTVPVFTMRPESMFDKLGSIVGLQDIDFDDHPEFSNLYLLKGDDEQQIRDFMDDSILTLMANKKKLCVEANPGRIIVYYSNRPPKADQLKSLFAEALEIFGAFDDRLREMK